MMANEIYISIIVGLITGILGLISGWILKSIDYEYRKKALRDKKFLEGRISSYLDLYEWVLKVSIYLRNYFRFLKDSNKDEVEFHIIQLDNMKKELPTIISRAYFYTNKNVEEKINNMTNKVEEAWSEGNKIILPSLNTGIVTEEQVKKFNSFINKIDKASNDFLTLVREDLGFEKKSKKKAKKGGM